MKELIISLILLCAVIILVIINANFLNDTVSTLKELATEAKESASPEALSKLYSCWEARKPFLELSASLREIDGVTENLLKLNAAISDSDSYRISQSYALFCTSLEDIQRFEQLSPGIIF